MFQYEDSVFLQYTVRENDFMNKVKNFQIVRRVGENQIKFSLRIFQKPHHIRFDRKKIVDVKLCCRLFKKSYAIPVLVNCRDGFNSP